VYDHPRNTTDENMRALAGLEKRGYKTGDIEKIMGRNFYRVFGEVIG